MPAALATKTAKTADTTPATFPLGFLDRAGDGASLAPLHALLSAAGALINPATAEGVAAIVTALAGVLTADTVVRAAATDRGGTITAGGTAQPLMAANATRRGFSLQNQSTGDLWINGLGAAAAGPTSLRIAAGQHYETTGHHVGTGAISIFGATTGQAFYAREF